MQEPGLDLHEWETRWQELQDLAADAPDETLPEIVRFVRQMLVERGYELDEPVTAEGEDPDIVRDFFAARDLAAATGWPRSWRSRPRRRASGSGRLRHDPRGRHSRGFDDVLAQLDPEYADLLA